MQVQRDELDGLAETHVVGEAAAEAELAHLGEPREAAALVGPQRGVEPGRLRELPGAVEVTQPLREPGQRAVDLDGDVSAVEGHRAGQRAGQRVGRAHSPSAAAEALQQRRIGDHPSAAQAHE